MWLIPIGVVALIVWAVATLVNRPAGRSVNRICPSCGKSAQSDWAPAVLRQTVELDCGQRRSLCVGPVVGPGAARSTASGCPSRILHDVATAGALSPPPHLV
jgi:hypothetical protein